VLKMEEVSEQMSLFNHLTIILVFNTINRFTCHELVKVLLETHGKVALLPIRVLNSCC